MYRFRQMFEKVIEYFNTQEEINMQKKQMIDILNAALATGGDYAELFFEDRIDQTIMIETDQTAAADTVNTFGCGVRILKENSCVYGYTNDCSYKSVKSLAEKLSASFKGERILEVSELKTVKSPGLNRIKVPYESVDMKEQIAFMKEAAAAAMAVDEKITRCDISYNHHTQKVTIANSKGRLVKDTRTRGRARITPVAVKPGSIQPFFTGPGASKGYDFFTEDIDVKAMAEEAAKAAVIMLDAVDCPSGEMPVIIDNAFGGVLFHEACGHSLEASSVAKGLSVFSGKKGQKIASDIFNAFDDGTIDNAWGSENFDDEGNRTQNKQLIKDGILVEYMIDDFNGRLMGKEGNGSCRRESYKYCPTSRMSNTFIGNGNSTKEEIFAATKFGLYAKTMGGGSVNPATGEFNFAVNEGYLIEDGKITKPVKGATLIGNGGDILFNVDMIANNLTRGEGMCGAASGSIPTDVGQPTIRLSSILVGGTGGKLK